MNISPIVKSLILIFCFVSLLNSEKAKTQGNTSYIGDRENIGIFGGPAEDISYSGIDFRIFAAVETPFTLFYSDDTCKTWQSAFPVDSMEYNLGTRGWGGGSSRVITNQVGWVAALTGLDTEFSATTISYDNGLQFNTAFDPFLLKKATGEALRVTAMGLSDHFCYTGLEKYVVRNNDTLPGEIILNINSLSGTTANSAISWLAPSNDPSGYPYYLVVNEPSQKTHLYAVYYGIVFELIAPAVNQQFQNIFTHPAQVSGDTVFASVKDTVTNQWKYYRSFSGGFGWTEITPSSNPGRPLHDVDYSLAWQIQVPSSSGIRLSFAGGPISDDLGNTWQDLAAGLLRKGIATHTLNKDIILISNSIGIAASTTGIQGPFINPSNIGFASVTINDFSESQGIYYAATKSGLAYTSAYFNSLVNGYEQWIPPDGLFPVPGVGDNFGISSVAIDPVNPAHVICGDNNGFYVTFNGPGNFTPVFPPDWNANPHLDPFVTDILFINSMEVLAVTGQKFEPFSFSPPQSIGNIWRSSDGGMNWYIVTPLFPVEYTMGNCLAMGFDVSQIVIYSGTGFAQTPGYNVAGGLWASFDLGDSWTKVNDAPLDPSGFPQPIYDIDVDPGNGQLIWITARKDFARSEDGGNSYFIADVPTNMGDFTSALIDPDYPDSLVITAGRNILKYSYALDDADLKFKGLPGEKFICSSIGSVLGGSNTGASKIIEAPTHYLDIKVYIEGAFNGTDLNTTLNTNGYLPLSQPFNVPPWNYNGSEHVSYIPNGDVVDWILIDLRNTTGLPETATAETRFDRKAAFLMKDGTIKDDDGTTQPRFNLILNTNKGSEKIHGVVYSPAHTGIRTADSLSQAKSLTFSYDFTNDPTAAYGGKESQKEIAPGIWGLYSGDGNHDNQVDNADKNEVWALQQGNTGYYPADFNRDGTVDLTDLDDFWKPNSGHGSKIE